MHFPNEIQVILELIQQHKLKEAYDLLNDLDDPSLCGRSFLFGISAALIGFTTLASRHLEHELQNFPDNVAARSYLDKITADNEKGAQLRTPQEESSKISFVVQALDGIHAYLPTLKSICLQQQRNLEIILLVNEADRDFAQSLIGSYPIESIVVGNKNSIGKGISRCFEEAKGAFLTLVMHPSTTWSDTGLVVATLLLQAQSDVNFVKGEDLFLNQNGFVSIMDANLQTWNRKKFLQESNFFEPMQFISPETVVWRKTLLNSLPEPLFSENSSALDFEIWAKLFQVTQLHTMATPIAVREWSLVERGRQLPIKYISDALVLMHQERSRSAGELDLLPPPPLVRFEPHNNAALRPEEVPKDHSLPQARLEVIVPNPERITVVMPSFNQGDFIEESIDSVLSQGWPNLEFIIVDGGSSDSTLQIVDKYKKHLSYFRTGPDLGQYHAVQEGFSHSTGSIMTWLNSDDVYFPWTFTNVADQFAQHENLRWLTGKQANINLDKKYKLGCLYTYNREHFINDGFDKPFIQQEGTFWRRNLWEQAGGSLDLRWKLAAELELWVRFFRYSQLYTVDCPLAYFRYQANQRSNLQLMEYIREAQAICAHELKLIDRGHYTEMLPTPEVLKSSKGFSGNPLASLAY